MKIWDLAARAGRFAWWRTYTPWALPLADRLAARWGLIARWIRFPLPWMMPYRRRAVHVVRGASMGDVLMCTPALRELKRRNPDCHLTFYTDFPALVEGLPFMDSVRPAAERPARGILLNYENSLPPRRHIAQIIGDYLGVNVRDVRPSCTVRPDLVERIRLDWSGRPRPWIVVIRRAGPWTPNKDWPDIYWEALLDRLLASMTVVEIGTGLYGRRTRTDPNYLDLVDRTSLPQLVASIAAADLLIAPDTGPMHIAAAVGTPSVVIYGGYIDPVSTGYPGNIDFYSAVECAPCWLRTPCPIGLKCLHKITPGQVEAAVDRLWADIRRLQADSGSRDAPRDRAPVDAATATATDPASSPARADSSGHRSQGECREDPIEIGTDPEDR
jgi:ADP-heptose:LPS heptosyltransferase